MTGHCLFTGQLGGCGDRVRVAHSLAAGIQGQIRPAALQHEELNPAAPAALETGRSVSRPLPVLLRAAFINKLKLLVLITICNEMTLCE